MKKYSIRPFQDQQIPREEIPFPGVSSFKKKKLLFLFPYIQLEDKTIVLGTWIFKPITPIICVLVTIAGLIYAHNSVYSNFQNGKIFEIINFILFFFFIFAYFNTIFTGPGYFPFYWAVRKDIHNDMNVNIMRDFDDEKPFKIIDEFDPAGMATRNNQLLWARQHQRPGRSIVSNSAKRIVIRPDHYCNWSESWIGKRNQKLFILFTLYAFLSCSMLSLFSAYLTYKDISGKKLSFQLFYNIPLLIHAIGTFIAIYFGLFAFSFTSVSFMFLIQGITVWEHDNNIPKEKFAKSLRENLEEVFGSVSKFYTWFIPFSPFSYLTNDELVVNYVSYYD